MKFFAALLLLLVGCATQPVPVLTSPYDAVAEGCNYLALKSEADAMNIDEWVRSVGGNAVLKYNHTVQPLHCRFL